MKGEEKVCFPAGDLRLEGLLAQPARMRGAIVMCHPHPQYGGTMENNVVEAITRRLQSEGFATLRFNFRGVGGSEGSYGELVGECEDARGAVRLLRERTGLDAVVLGGYSFGAVVALQTGHADVSVECLVAVAPPLSLFDIRFLHACKKPKLLLAGDRDQFCPAEAFGRTAAILAEPKTCVQLAGADHFFVGREGELAEHVARFAAPCRNRVED